MSNYPNPERLTATDEPDADASEQAGVQEPIKPTTTAAPVEAETDAESTEPQLADEPIEPDFTTPVEREPGAEVPDEEATAGQ